jgi:hypothetical protein
VCADDPSQWHAPGLLLKTSTLAEDGKLWLDDTIGKHRPAGIVDRVDTHGLGPP